MCEGFVVGYRLVMSVWEGFVAGCGLVEFVVILEMLAPVIVG